MIEVNNISYHYHGGKDVLKDVSFALEQGQFLAILGNNGVGKSTLLKCLNKILRADSSQVCPIPSKKRKKRLVSPFFSAVKPELL